MTFVFQISRTDVQCTRSTYISLAAIRNRSHRQTDQQTVKCRIICIKLYNYLKSICLLWWELLALYFLLHFLMLRNGIFSTISICVYATRLATWLYDNYQQLNRCWMRRIFGVPKIFLWRCTLRSSLAEQLISRYNCGGHTSEHTIYCRKIKCSVFTLSPLYHLYSFVVIVQPGLKWGKFHGRGSKRWPRNGGSALLNRMCRVFLECFSVFFFFTDSSEPLKRRLCFLLDYSTENSNSSCSSGQTGKSPSTNGWHEVFCLSLGIGSKESQKCNK